MIFPGSCLRLMKVELHRCRIPLAHSKQFDTTDRDSHFTTVVPQRAMYCPVLLYVICTALARHLARIWSKQYLNQVVEFHGIPLLDFDEKSAIHYHGVCISYLIEVSKDLLKSYNEDALAAVTILRFYEQVDSEHPQSWRLTCFSPF
jgi:hypothetical protein